MDSLEPKKKALLVEDNEMNVKLFSLLLKKANVNFDCAMDGEAAINLFNNNHYDIVLTDIHMPNFHGDELARRIRCNDNKAKAKIPIIALTASIQLNELDLYLASGINKILIKPFKQEEFKAMLDTYLVDY